MKWVIFVLITLAGLHHSLNAQDVILKRTGEKIEAKVLEIGTNEIKYKKFSNLEGPTYNIEKREVFEITYKNGEVEKFENISQLEYNNDNSSNKNDGRIQIIGGRFYVGNRRIGTGELRSLLISTKDEEIIKLYKQSVVIRGLAYLFGFGLIPVSLGGIYLELDVGSDRKSTRLNSSHIPLSRMPSSA